MLSVWLKCALRSISTIWNRKTSPCEYVSDRIYTSICISPWRSLDFPLRSSKSAVLYVQQRSIWQPVTRPLSDYWHQRDAEREDASVCDCSGAGGQPNNNKGPALSLSPVIFQLSEKLLWCWKKVKLKSLAWYVLTTACRLQANTFWAVTVAVFGGATVPLRTATGQVTASVWWSVQIIYI